MAVVVVFLNLYGLTFNEWRGAGTKTKSLACIGIVVLLITAAVIGFRNVLATRPSTDSSALESYAWFDNGLMKNGHHRDLRIDEATFNDLFDGKSLAGWFHGIDGYEIIDGTIRCKSGSESNILTTAEYDDFILSFEFRLPSGGNSGLAIRAPSTTEAPHLDGIELQILDDSAEQYQSLQSYQYHGSAYGMAPAKRGYLKPVGMWNHELVVAQGDQITVMLNGFTILDVNLADVREHTLDGLPHPGAFRTNGHIGFCGHGDPVAFRNIRISRLQK